jgi:hypothetical protein
MTLSLLTIPQNDINSPCLSLLQVDIAQFDIPAPANFPVAGNIKPGPVINQMQMLDLKSLSFCQAFWMNLIKRIHNSNPTQGFDMRSHPSGA